MSEYREIRGSLQWERCEHKSWTDLCERCEIDRLTAENERLRAALRGVIRVADRKTVEFDEARAALEEK